MSVILETSKGDLVVDLYVEECPKAATNFLKLCKIKYYNNCLFYNVQQNFIVQSGDPTNTGKGGESVWGVLYGEQARLFEDEIRPHLKHNRKGLLGMAGAGKDMNGSQFYITTGENLHSLDEKHTIFGEVAEGLEVLEAIDSAPCDDGGRPLQNIRIRHTIVLDDPLPDPRGLEDNIPDTSPEPQFADDGRLEDDWVPDEDTRDPDEIEKTNREKEAHNRAVVLEMIGDLPEADAKPPPNMLFICKLNPVTTEEDLEIIFSRFGTITSCDIIRDWKTGDSLNYGFIGFDSEDACEQAFFKMNNVLIDDRRIKVDFSQSVSHLWKQFKRFGRKGNADLGAEAETHQRQQGASGPAASRLELKAKYLPMAGYRPGWDAARGRRGDYSLVLGDADADEHPQAPAPGVRPHRAHEDRPASHGRDRKQDRRRRSGSRSREQQRERRRSRSRSRDRQQDERDRKRREQNRSSERRRSHSRERAHRQSSRGAQRSRSRERVRERSGRRGER